jgi:hypothetical protein
MVSRREKRVEFSTADDFERVNVHTLSRSPHKQRTRLERITTGSPACHPHAMLAEVT